MRILLLFAAISLVTQVGQEPRPGAFDDPQALETFSTLTQSPAPIIGRSGFQPRTWVTQVSLGPVGRKVIRDAANEPSIAVDPTAPSRIVIAWRQFDDISSYFRQAGFARSRDGGRTRSVGRLERGVFRADPILRADHTGRIHWNVCQCLADVDDGGGTGRPDGGVTLEDLAFYLAAYDGGTLEADVDDGAGRGTLDDAVTIETPSCTSALISRAASRDRFEHRYSQ
jgi:hypothetical protein